jgi:DeoR/GlpR family transcriptional regulator of sugar metabolism
MNRIITERRWHAIQVAMRKGHVTVADLRARWNWLCTETFRRDLKALEVDGVLTAHGERRGRYYTWTGRRPTGNETER